ncbi:MAG: hypothetical protein DRP02_01825 [Candidatus Gerdarchaeota archaeon]|nr:MAG: hypothetical protein DRP02_01825 [Candidatus Gerdarchaeota archaeon]
MDIYTDAYRNGSAFPAVEINIRPSLLYTEEYSYLTRDELEVLFLLATTEMLAEGLTLFSFSGIKRQLGKHQQKITKAVNRLLTKELLYKNKNHYSLSQKGLAILSEIVKVQNAIDLHQSSTEFLQQIVVFDSNIPLDDFSSFLVGKWFGAFRYLSHTEGKNFIIRWQLVDSRSIASLEIYKNELILTIIPEKNDKQKLPYEQALDSLSQYITTFLKSLGVTPTTEYQGWRKSSVSKIEYQQKLLSWLNSAKSFLSEN